MGRLNDYKLKDDSTLLWDTDQKKKIIHKKPKIEKKARPKIKITFQHKENMFAETEVESTLVNSIYNLKTNIGQKFGINPKYIQFTFKGNILNDKKNLKKCNILQNAILEWKKVDDVGLKSMENEQHLTY